MNGVGTGWGWTLRTLKTECADHSKNPSCLPSAGLLPNCLTRSSVLPGQATAPLKQLAVGREESTGSYSPVAAPRWVPQPSPWESAQAGQMVGSSPETSTALDWQSGVSTPLSGPGSLAQKPGQSRQRQPPRCPWGPESRTEGL